MSYGDTLLATGERIADREQAALVRASSGALGSRRSAPSSRSSCSSSAAAWPRTAISGGLRTRARLDHPGPRRGRLIWHADLVGWR